MTFADSVRDPALSHLYQEYASAEPPAALDTVILRAARQAMQTSAPNPVSWWKKMMVPMAVATTVVLAAMLSLTADRQPAERPALPAEQAPAPVERREAQAVSRDDKIRQKREPDWHPAKAGTVPAKRPASSNKSPADSSPPSGISAFPVQADQDRGALGRITVPPPPPKPLKEEIPHKEEKLTETPRMPFSSTNSLAKPAPPELLVEQIRRLREQGQIDDAERLLAELRRTHPSYHLPIDLR